VLDDDVEHVVAQLGDVAGSDVVPAPVPERRVEHLLMGQERLGREEVEHR
jgi:hypothetical protein